MNIKYQLMTPKQFQEYKEILLKEHKDFGKHLQSLKFRHWKIREQEDEKDDIMVATYTEIFDKWWEVYMYGELT